MPPAKHSTFMSDHSSMSDSHIGEISENIDGFITGPLDGFFSKYFGNAASDDAFQKTVREVCAHHPLEGATTSVEGFCRWISALPVEDYVGARGSWKMSCHTDEMYKTDLSAQLSFIFTNNGTYTESDQAAIQIIGEFCPGQGISYTNGLLNLCARASALFMARPTRLFLHGLYLRGNLAELFVFDRCGLYSCNVFNIYEDFQRFITALLKYSSMTDAELGLSDIIRHDGVGPFVTLKKDACTTLTSSTLRLANRPLAIPEDMVSKATTCFRARMPDSDRWDYVVKFKWRLRDDIPEDQVLRHANKRNVWGLLSLDYFDEIIDTAELRSGLRHRPNRRFPPKDGPDMSVPSGRGVDSHTVETDETFRVRTMVCIITSPCGRPLHTHESVLELLQVLRDAVKSHRSLYEDGGILHQDIAPGNIVISERVDPEAPKGILIDLDVAMILDVGPRNPGGISITGTPPFMAIGALRGRPRTYRHDLESFLYVLLWAVIADGSESPPEGSRLQRWRRGGYEEMAGRKMVDMAPDGFQSILLEFASKYQTLRPLVEGFRQLLFPIREDDGTLWTGTVSSQDGRAMLYDGILQMFDKAITLQKS
ncbi:hypothetical protein CTA2_8440 [Colletotrichum tanaceti]|uniref:Protein kinase domain-containing protein n=1 Tax=Colletotrichum tanaceti TaxID=1306861 RepID=A0A4U6XSL1_9PEZI|nr:hypothetical protein CTA2_8431 [Colletotrichum tanaceti]KAJ0168218.1 hypothetical protein CTA2_8440 [Colletotrichum tanaceti]TKW58913.1 hypothetical protein CTA1_608 [Colletotrichum tanaceti]